MKTLRADDTKCEKRTITLFDAVQSMHRSVRAKQAWWEHKHKRTAYPADNLIRMAYAECAAQLKRIMVTYAPQPPPRVRRMFEFIPLLKGKDYPLMKVLRTFGKQHRKKMKVKWQTPPSSSPAAPSASPGRTS